MYEMYLALALGVVASLITSTIKKYKPDMDGRVTQMAVLAACFVLALIVTIIQKYAPAEMLATIGTSFAAAVGWYEVVMKNQS